MLEFLLWKWGWRRTRVHPFEDGLQPKIHEVWTLSEDSVTREVHMTAHIDGRTGFIGGFETKYLTPSWHRIPKFGVNSINGSVEWLGFPNFLSTNGPPWTDNIFGPGPIWWYGGTTTNHNRGSQPGGPNGIVSVLWNFSACVCPYYVRKSPENMRTASRRLRDNHLWSRSLARMHSPSTSRNPICNL